MPAVINVEQAVLSIYTTITVVLSEPIVKVYKRACENL